MSAGPLAQLLGDELKNVADNTAVLFNLIFFFQKKHNKCFTMLVIKADPSCIITIR